MWSFSSQASCASLSSMSTIQPRPSPPRSASCSPRLSRSSPTRSPSCHLLHRTFSSNTAGVLLSSTSTPSLTPDPISSTNLQTGILKLLQNRRKHSQTHHLTLIDSALFWPYTPLWEGWPGHPSEGQLHRKVQHPICPFRRLLHRCLTAPLPGPGAPPQNLRATSSVPLATFPRCRVLHHQHGAYPFPCNVLFSALQSLSNLLCFRHRLPFPTSSLQPGTSSKSHS